MMQFITYYIVHVYMYLIKAVHVYFKTLQDIVMYPFQMFYF